MPVLLSPFNDQGQLVAEMAISDGDGTAYSRQEPITFQWMDVVVQTLDLNPQQVDRLRQYQSGKSVKAVFEWMAKPWDSTDKGLGLDWLANTSADTHYELLTRLGELRDDTSLQVQIDYPDYVSALNFVGNLEASARAAHRKDPASTRLDERQLWEKLAEWYVDRLDEQLPVNAKIGVYDGIAEIFAEFQAMGEKHQAPRLAIATGASWQVVERLMNAIRKSGVIMNTGASKGVVERLKANPSDSLNFIRSDAMSWVAAGELVDSSGKALLPHMEKFKSKPDPASALFLCNAAGVHPSKVVMFGDAKADMWYAIQSGMKFVGVPFGDPKLTPQDFTIDAILAEAEEKGYTIPDGAYLPVFVTSWADLAHDSVSQSAVALSNFEPSLNKSDPVLNPSGGRDLVVR